MNAMIRFRNYEEYLSARKSQEEALNRMGKDRKKRYELVLEENTIYEIDLECEECLKKFWREKGSGNT